MADGDPNSAFQKGMKQLEGLGKYIASPMAVSVAAARYLHEAQRLSIALLAASALLLWLFYCLGRAGSRWSRHVGQQHDLLFATATVMTIATVMLVAIVAVPPLTRLVEDTPAPAVKDDDLRWDVGMASEEVGNESAPMAPACIYHAHLEDLPVDFDDDSTILSKEMKNRIVQFVGSKEPEAIDVVGYPDPNVTYTIGINQARARATAAAQFIQTVPITDGSPTIRARSRTEILEDRSFYDGSRTGPHTRLVVTGCQREPSIVTDEPETLRGDNPDLPPSAAGNFANSVDRRADALDRQAKALEGERGR